ncbi:MAG: hypothetical protein IPK99_14580 [Flavobacteriales bacterium]|nr:hypothetical protein [Flavobacteriales bacterium]
MRTSDGDRFTCRQVVADIHPAPLLGMLEGSAVRPAYRNRVGDMRNTIGSFTVHLALEPGVFPYYDHNHYHFRDHDVWAPMDAERAAREKDSTCCSLRARARAMPTSTPLPS